jgi:two-component sensor histidine kinase
LFTNAIKYAFPAEINGEIYISLLREGDKEENGNMVSNDISSSRSPDLKSSLSKSRTCEHFTLVFADNGKGFPEDIDFRNSTSLGLQLVNALVDQIVENIKLERNIGTKFIIKFKG